MFRRTSFQEASEECNVGAPRGQEWLRATGTSLLWGLGVVRMYPRGHLVGLRMSKELDSRPTLCSLRRAQAFPVSSIWSFPHPGRLRLMKGFHGFKKKV